jgi:hypothetical protein
MTMQGFSSVPHGITRIYPSSIGSMQGTSKLKASKNKEKRNGGPQQ